MEILRGEDPVSFFRNWMAEAEKSEPSDPEAMTLATIGADGLSDARMVLLKGFGLDGFRFYTNMESKKGRDIAAHPFAALCFHWKSLRRQVRITGPVRMLDDAETDAYFKTRHPLSQLGAWASRQSQPLDSRAALKTTVEEFKKKFEGKDIPRPPHWKGYIVAPEKMEFWQEGEGRLHDRFLFTRKKDGWDMTRLNP